MRKAVFLDKDGTLVEDVPYNVDPARMTLAVGASDAARRLVGAGYALVVVTNQSGVARAVFHESALTAVETALRRLLPVELAGFYYCPHHPDGVVATYAVDCDCRKPQPGLLLRAAAEHDFDLAASWMVGDILNDVEAGVRAGCRTVLIDNGGETEWVTDARRTPDHVVANMAEAAHVILAAEALAA